MAPLFDKKFGVRQGGEETSHSGHNRIHIRGLIGPEGWGEGWGKTDRIFAQVHETVPTRIVIKKVDPEWKGRKNGVVKLSFRKAGINQPAYLSAVVTVSKWPFTVQKIEGKTRGVYIPVPTYVSPDRIMLDLVAVSEPNEFYTGPKIDQDTQLLLDEPEPEPRELALIKTEPDPSPEVIASEIDMTDMEEFMIETCRMAQEGGWILEVAGVNQLSAFRKLRAGLEVRITTPTMERDDGT